MPLVHPIRGRVLIDALISRNVDLSKKCAEIEARFKSSLEKGAQGPILKCLDIGQHWIATKPMLRSWKRADPNHRENELVGKAWPEPQEQNWGTVANHLDDAFGASPAMAELDPEYRCANQTLTEYLSGFDDLETYQAAIDSLLERILARPLYVKVDKAPAPIMLADPWWRYQKRESKVLEILDRLPRHRVVTLQGMSGTGKSILARHVVKDNRTAERYGNRIVYVNLAGVRTPDVDPFRSEEKGSKSSFDRFVQAQSAITAAIARKIVRRSGSESARKSFALDISQYVMDICKSNYTDISVKPQRDDPTRESVAEWWRLLTGNYPEEVARRLPEKQFTSTGHKRAWALLADRPQPATGGRAELQVRLGAAILGRALTELDHIASEEGEEARWLVVLDDFWFWDHLTEWVDPVDQEFDLELYSPERGTHNYLTEPLGPLFSPRCLSDIGVDGIPRDTESSEVSRSEWFPTFPTRVDVLITSQLIKNDPSFTGRRIDIGELVHEGGRIDPLAWLILAAWAQPKGKRSRKDADRQIVALAQELEDNRVPAADDVVRAVGGHPLALAALGATWNALKRPPDFFSDYRDNLHDLYGATWTEEPTSGIPAELRHRLVLEAIRLPWQTLSEQDQNRYLDLVVVQTGAEFDVARFRVLWHSATRSPKLLANEPLSSENAADGVMQKFADLSLVKKVQDDDETVDHFALHQLHSLSIAKTLNEADTKWASKQERHSDLLLSCGVLPAADGMTVPKYAATPDDGIQPVSTRPNGRTFLKKTSLPEDQLLERSLSLVLRDDLLRILEAAGTVWTFAGVPVADEARRRLLTDFGFQRAILQSDVVKEGMSPRGRPDLVNQLLANEVDGSDPTLRYLARLWRRIGPIVAVHPDEFAVQIALRLRTEDQGIWSGATA